MLRLRPNYTLWLSLLRLRYYLALMIHTKITIGDCLLNQNDELGPIFGIFAINLFNLSSTTRTLSFFVFLGPSFDTSETKLVWTTIKSCLLSQPALLKTNWAVKLRDSFFYPNYRLSFRLFTLQLLIAFHLQLIKVFLLQFCILKATSNIIFGIAVLFIRVFCTIQLTFAKLSPKFRTLILRCFICITFRYRVSQLFYLILGENYSHNTLFLFLWFCLLCNYLVLLILTYCF